MSTEHYLFIVDTNSYAGNFERDMCAYMTGQVGDCGVGGGCAKVYQDEETEEFNNVIHVPDEHGCSRPVTMWDSPNGDYNSVAIYFDPTHPPTADQIALLRLRAYRFLTASKAEFDSRPTEILGFRLVEKRTEYVETTL